MTIMITDIEISQELDQKAMASTKGGHGYWYGGDCHHRYDYWKPRKYFDWCKTPYYGYGYGSFEGNQTSSITITGNNNTVTVEQGLEAFA
jgi:hypothetical protein